MFLDFEQVKGILRQRFPLLMVDRVIELEKGKRITAVKNVSGNEICFLGHFPEKAIMPGVLIIETIAQTASIFFDVSKYEVQSEKQGMNVLASVNLRFLKPVVPGDVLVVKEEFVKFIEHGCVVKVAATVDAELVAKGELICGEVSAL